MRKISLRGWGTGGGTGHVRPKRERRQQLHTPTTKDYCLKPFISLKVSPYAEFSDCGGLGGVFVVLLVQNFGLEWMDA
ncbi:hypothetical protein Ac2012v2_005424 [Leucoagaricus gongylophorus]